MKNGNDGSRSLSCVIQSMASSAMAVIRFQPGLPRKGLIGVVLRVSIGSHWLVSPATTTAAERQLELSLQQARYEAAHARRQYDAVDPANRLVAGELERRWNEAL